MSCLEEVCTLLVLSSSNICSLRVQYPLLIQINILHVPLSKQGLLFTRKSKMTIAAFRDKYIFIKRQEDALWELFYFIYHAFLHFLHMSKASVLHQMSKFVEYVFILWNNYENKGSILRHVKQESICQSLFCTQLTSGSSFYIQWLSTSQTTQPQSLAKPLNPTKAYYLFSLLVICNIMHRVASRKHPKPLF